MQEIVLKRTTSMSPIENSKSDNHKKEYLVTIFYSQHFCLNFS